MHHERARMEKATKQQLEYEFIMEMAVSSGVNLGNCDFELLVFHSIMRMFTKRRGEVRFLEKNSETL
ncbi:hypothetical protein PsorP6_000765 [Peronosclerospora sorghi]|uniref:Uncharacterized protein n=1 Tax=Peronosclerospora sorghi TaxID=230839 RepID=A0ACC0WYC7_9STRA|nr:hypothetical protein PsorP6_000765 [Peronosclerospora sorghi]